MRIYVGFDDTDTTDSDRGTGKLARWFEGELPESCKLWGVVRQQLLMDDAIPYTTHNSSACAIIETPDSSLLDELVSRAIKHIEHHFIRGSDPGLCAAYENHPALSRLISFGRSCATRIVTQGEALQSASGAHLSGHGGTNDGIIGAAAAVGLTAYGWSGRFIEFGRLRDFPEMVPVSELERAGMAVVSIDRDGKVPAPEDQVNTKGWLRPRLWGRAAVLPVIPGEDHAWEMVGDKKRNDKEG
jgi:hypothetical protein